MNRRDIITKAMASAGMLVIDQRSGYAGSRSPQCPSVPAPPSALPAMTAAPLGTIAASKNLGFGVQLSIATNPIYGNGMYDPVYRQAVFREKPSFVAYGSAFKFGDVCPDPPTSSGSLVFTQKAYGVTNTWYQAEDLTTFVKPQGARARADALIWNDTAVNPNWLKPLPANANATSAEFKYNLSFIPKYMSAAFKKVTELQGADPAFFQSIGVINEPIIPNFSNPRSPAPAYFRPGPWMWPGQQVAGFSGVPEYIRVAFSQAEYFRAGWARVLKRPATTAKFFVNESLCETDQFGPTVRPALLTLLRNMLAAKLNVKGVGLECHLQPQMMKDPYHPDWTVFGYFIQEIGQLGLEVYITELDVLDYETSCFGASGSIAQSEQLIDIYYDTFLRKVLSYGNVKSITLWDLSDRYTFYRDMDESTWAGYNQIPRPRPVNTPWPVCRTLPANAKAISCARPVVFDDAMRPKPARQKVAAALSVAPRR